MYIAAGQGQTTARGQNFDVNRNLLSLRSFATSLKKSLWSLILYTFLHDFIHVYSPGAGADNPQGSKFWSFVTSFICCKFQKNLFLSDFIQFFNGSIHVYSPRVGADSLQGTIETSCYFVYLLQVKKQCLWSLILYNFFHDLIHV